MAAVMISRIRGSRYMILWIYYGVYSLGQSLAQGVALS